MLMAKIEPGAPTGRRVYGKPWSKMANVPVSRQALAKLGRCLVKILSDESKKYFAKRGWTGQDPMQGPPIWKSFHFEIKGPSSLEIWSSFYGMAELARGDIPSRKMTWITQQAKDGKPGHYRRTRTEQRLRMKVGGRVSKGQRMPLIVPIREKGGTIVFRTAPLKFADAWVHPGIAKFTFFETAIRKGREKCAEIMRDEAARVLEEGNPTR